MIVGAAVVDIHVAESRSLKAKRGVVKAITQRVRNRMNLAVAEAAVAMRISRPSDNARTPLSPGWPPPVG